MHDLGTAPAAVERAARGAPSLQVAEDGWWEHAAAVSLPATPQDADGLLERPTGRDVAVEVLWPGPPIVFVGVRFGRRGRPPLRAVAARGDWTPSQALDLLAGGRLGPPVRAELGAVNAWRSVGPLALAIDARPAAIEQALAGRPDLASCRLPVALEVVLEHPDGAWWAIEVSARRDGGHRVRVERVAELLASIGPRAHGG